MTRFAARTSVPVGKTQAQIQAVVRKYGASGFASGWEDKRAAVSFACAGRHVRFSMQLPQGKNEEQTQRQMWRALLLLVKAKLEAVESKIVTFEEEFLAHIVLPDGGTVYERARESLHIAYESGVTPALLGCSGGRH